MSWISDLLDMTEEAETPKSFIFWAGLSAISAIVGRDIYLDKHYYKLYPNIYVMLVAPSGGRKSFGIYVAKTLVEGVGGYRIISGRASIQAIVKDLATSFTLPDGKVVANSWGFIASSEFASAIVDDPAALTILTDLYDSHVHAKEWRSILKGTGTETLKEPNLVMLSASNEAHLFDKLKAVDIEGGFIGRTIVVVETKKRTINPLVKAPKKTFDPKHLIKYLEKLKGLKGPFVWSVAAGDLFEEWYREHSRKLEAQEISDKTGTLDRMHDQILKVAMLLSLADTPNLILEKAHVEQAIDVCTISTSAVERAVTGKGSAALSRGTRVVITALLRSPTNSMSRSELLRKNYGEFDAVDLDRIVDTLEQAKAIRIVRNGLITNYELTKKFLEEFNKGLKDKGDPNGKA